MTRPAPLRESLQRSLQIFHAQRAARARPATHVPSGTPLRRRTGNLPAHAARSRDQPPLAPVGADAAPGMLAAPPAVPLPGMPEGAVDGAGAMPPVALVSELAPVPVSLFF
ncbi:hypothetical protein [Burkholderia sp. MSMB0856]|uniref:hypothetical protein n=1 Tax=Burkholderia sp. MSMB0856 TaxID=1637869 RepID=UPI00131F28F7|nr:hypothetical protein [Burkholderia sp. MSMB0856]